MKRIFSLNLLVAIVILVTPVMVNDAVHAQTSLRVTMVVNGTLGDKSFFDSAQRGLEMAKKDLGIEYTIIETGEDQARWEPALDDAMANVDAYDILIAGTFQMAQYLTARADNYPDKKFFAYDTAVDYTQCKCANVYSVTYAQNEGSYLAGVYVASMMKEGKLEGLAGKNAVGAIGGLDIPVINDFIVGYEQGTQSVTPEITVLRQYVAGSAPFFDPAKGKEIALSMYEQGADFVFGVAGGSSLGMIEAAKEKGRYFIGVDSDQAMIIKETDPEGAKRILTSMLKNVDKSLYRAIKLHLEGTLVYGKEEVVGLAEDAVDLAVNEIYDATTPDSIKELIQQTKQDIIDCKIIVTTAMASNNNRCANATATPEATAAK